MKLKLPITFFIKTIFHRGNTENIHINIGYVIRGIGRLISRKGKELKLTTKLYYYKKCTYLTLN